MAEPKKETVRIALPPRPQQAESDRTIVKRDTARVGLPTRTPIAPIRRSPPSSPPKITPLPDSEAPAVTTTILRRPPAIKPANTSPLLQPLPKPPGGETAIGPESSVVEAASINRGPKKETTRINILPRPAAPPAPPINMTKTQPLLVHPVGTAQPAPVVIPSRPITPIDAIPRPLGWTLVGISTVIFLIQIWNYVVS